MTAPILSIITPCLNRSAFIADAVESVMNQDYANVEHMILDGGSTDATLAILAEYPHLKVLSEKDSGMYDAINKGLGISQGEIVGLLNSDDVYESKIFSMIMKEFELHPDIDVVAGKASYFMIENEGRKILKVLPAVSPENFEYVLMRGIPIINAWFFRRRVFEKLGQFDRSFFIAADRDFQARCLVNKVKIKPVDDFFYHYRYHQDSMTVNSDLVKQEKYLSENLRIARNYGQMDFGNQLLANKFIYWQDLVVFEIFISNMRRKNFRKSFGIMISAIAERPVRLFIYASQFPLRLVAYLYRIAGEAFHP